MTTRWLRGIRPCALVGIIALSPSVMRAQISFSDTTGLPPAGFGTLRQGDISIRLQGSAIALQMYPLHEAIIRLLAPDTYRSLHRLAERHMDEIQDAVQMYALGDPAIFVVTFFGREARARFDPDELTITSQNRLFRPVSIIPISPSWTRHELERRETATAIYVYESGIRLLEPLAVEYRGARVNQWESLLQNIEEELARVRTRARDLDSGGS